MSVVLKFIILSVVLFISACSAVQDRAHASYTPDELKALAKKDTAMLTETQGLELDAYWLRNSSGIFKQCRSQYPEDKQDISLIIKNDLSGKVIDVWMLNGGPAGACLVQYLHNETMPKPPFEPFFSPLYANP